MPLYEYQCTQCNAREEIIQKHSDPLTSQCPKCGGDMKRLFSAPAIQFKGSGFYKTDYAAKPAASSTTKSSSDTSESKSDAKTESKTETKSESKSESKTETKSESKSETKASD